MLFTLRRFRARTTSGFSLVELSVVVAILAVVAALGLEAAANFVNKTSGSVTKDRLVIIDDAIAKFFKIYGRLPCPATRALAPTNSSYGIEDCTITAISASAASPNNNGSDTGGGILFGALPFRTLNLPMALSLDGFGSKLDYAVTKNLTVAGGTAGSGGFGSYTTPTPVLATDGIAGIEVRTGVLEQNAAPPYCGSSKCQVVANPATYEGAAYIVISHGADRRGAVSAKGTSLSNCIPSPNSSFYWRVDSQNCIIIDGYGTLGNSTLSIPKNVFYDNRLNSGLNQKSYFDDFVVWRSKAQL